jgi:hypothetical protein
MSAGEVAEMTRGATYCFWWRQLGRGELVSGADLAEAIAANNGFVARLEAIKDRAEGNRPKGNGSGEPIVID